MSKPQSHSNLSMVEGARKSPTRLCVSSYPSLQQFLCQSTVLSHEAIQLGKPCGQGQPSSTTIWNCHAAVKAVRPIPPGGLEINAPSSHPGPLSSSTWFLDHTGTSRGKPCMSSHEITRDYMAGAGDYGEASCWSATFNKTLYQTLDNTS